jgi:hypothetical protein
MRDGSMNSRPKRTLRANVFGEAGKRPTIHETSDVRNQPQKCGQTRKGSYNKRDALSIIQLVFRLDFAVA